MFHPWWPDFPQLLIVSLIGWRKVGLKSIAKFLYRQTDEEIKSLRKLRMLRVRTDEILQKIHYFQYYPKVQYQFNLINTFSDVRVFVRSPTGILSSSPGRAQPEISIYISIEAVWLEKTQRNRNFLHRSWPGLEPMPL